MEKRINNNYYNWDISKGDYKREPDCTSTFEKLRRRKQLRNKILKLTGLGGLIILIITVFAFLIN